MSPLYKKVSDVTEEMFDKVVGVNLKGPFRLMALIGERMIESGGSIINISSTASQNPATGLFLTDISKAWDGVLRVDGGAH